MSSPPSARSRPTLLLRSIAAAVVLAAACAGFAAQGSPAGAKGRYTVKTIQLAKGVQLLEVHDSKGPNRIRVIRMDPKLATLDVGDAGPTWPAYAPTSSIAKAHHAVAAINGDFAKDGHPWHPYMEDGMPGTTGFNVGLGILRASERQERLRRARADPLLGERPRARHAPEGRRVEREDQEVRRARRVHLPGRNRRARPEGRLHRTAGSRQASRSGARARSRSGARTTSTARSARPIRSRSAPTATR